MHQSIGDIVLIALALIAGVVVARAALGASSLRIVGALTMLGAAWLYPQRTDLISRMIIAGFFGFGLSLVVGRNVDDPERPSRKRTAISGAIVLVALLGFALYVGAETPTSHWFGGGITHGTNDFPQVALTFDDGPNLTATLPIMRILEAAHIKGTFFEVGKAIDAEPQITRTLHDHGQLLGNHSYNHDQWRWLDPRYPQLEQTQRAFQRATGICPAYYRPPHGERTPFVVRVVNNHHMRMILWNDSAGDWSETSAKAIARRIVRGASSGAIIVLHDGLDGNPTANRQVLVQAMPLIIQGLRERGFKIVGLDALIGGPTSVAC